MKLDPYLRPFTKIKWIKVLNLWPETVKFLEKQ